MTQKLDALIFDFDGLILDTETPEFNVLQEIYAEYGVELSIEKWGRIIGGSGATSFDAVSDIEHLAGVSIDRQPLLKRWRNEADARIAINDALPGVRDLLDDAQAHGLKLAIASSSPHWWVDSHLKKLGLYERFAHIVCADDVALTKPAPDLFLLAQTKLNVSADRAVIFEDSPNGVRAANAAKIPVVVVPNPVTEQLTFSGEYLRLSSLQEFSISKWTG